MSLVAPLLDSTNRRNNAPIWNFVVFELFSVVFEMLDFDKHFDRIFFRFNIIKIMHVFEAKQSYLGNLRTMIGEW